MRSQLSPARLRLTWLGWGLALPVLFLVVVGLACIHATDQGSAAPETITASDNSASARIQSALAAIGPLTLRQILHVLSGIALMLLALVPSYRRIGGLAFPIYWCVIAVLALLLVERFGRPFGIDLPFVTEKSRTWRWIQIGPLSLQPAEFMKLALVLALARYLRFRDSYRRWSGLVAPFLLTLLPMILILEEPDLGMVLMMLPVLLAMLLVAGARFRHLLIVLLIGAALMPVFYFFGMKDYQRIRVQVLLKQNSADEGWHQKQGYQLRQSKTALGVGGLTGQGYKQGAFVRYGLLPEEQNDFIFAIIGNQWGFVGCLLVMLAYAVITLVGLEIALVTNDPFGRLLAVGVVAMIVAQALLNMCVTTALAPTTGMTLPFVSAGGSSLWANFLALGVLVNVAQRRPLLIANPPFEHGH